MPPLSITSLAVVLCAAHLISSSPVSAIIPASESKILPRITKIKYQKLNSTKPEEKQVLPEMCLTNQTEYKLIIPSETRRNIFRIPHARIFEDEKPCGDQSLAETSLWAEDHMLLAPYWMMKTAAAAEKEGVDVTEMQAAFNFEYHWHLKRTARLMEGFVLGEEIWVGYEAGNRVCDGRTAVKAGTFVLFARTAEDRVVLENSNSRTVLQGKLSLVYTLYDPTKVETLFDIDDTTYIFQNVTDIHLAFTEVPEVKSDSYDMICPFAIADRQKDSLLLNTVSAAQPTEGADDDIYSSETLSCFPSDALLTRESGAAVSMSELEIGDRVLDINGKFTDVFMFTHKDMSPELHPFVELTTEYASGQTLTLSSGHYAYTSAGLKSASEIEIGMSLLKSEGQQTRVIKKRFVLRQGLYNPQSISGSLVVNGFAVSTYTTAVRPSLAHLLLGPMRELYRQSSANSSIRIYWMNSLFANGARKIDWLVVKLLGIRSSESVKC